MTEEEAQAQNTLADTHPAEKTEESENIVEEKKIVESLSTSNNNIDEETHENNTSDELIDHILKDVEEMRLNTNVAKSSSSPPKSTKQEDSAQSTPDSTILSSSYKQADDSNITIDSPPQTQAKEEEPIEVLKELPTREPVNKANIPNSVSQALFSQPLKVTKIREKAPTPKFVGIKKPADPAANKRFEELQRRDQELSQKIHKLNKEIDYLKSLVETVSVTSNLSELRKLKYAIEKLEEYLDKKQKEKYELGIQLTRAVRKRVDSGESGEFWVS